MVVLSKKLGQFRQWTGERLGVADKTQVSEDFQKLDLETESRKEGVEKLSVSLEDYTKTLDKRSSQDKKVSAMSMLAKAMIQQGHFHGDSSPIGMTLLRIGETEDKLKGLQEEFAETVRKGLLLDVMALHASMKDYDALKKKLENRRLDYDAKLNKVNKSKKEKPGLEEEMKTAQSKYNETLASLESLMSTFAEREELLLAPLVQFAEAQCHYYEASLSSLKEMCAMLKTRPTGGQYNERRKSEATSRSRFPTQGREKLPTILPPAMEAMARTKPFADDHTDEIGTLEAAQQQQQPPEPMSNLSRKQSVRLQDTHPTQGNYFSSTQQQSSRTVQSQGSRPFQRQDSIVDEGNGVVDGLLAKERVIAQYDFVAENENEMSIARGDIIEVLDHIDDGWWLGKCGQSQGIFPANYAQSVRDSIDSNTLKKDENKLMVLRPAVPEEKAMPLELRSDWLVGGMGKAFGGNSKAEAGRERKAAHKELKKMEQQKKKEEAESREWEEGVKTKSERQILEENKRTERLQRKQEREKLEALEAAELEKYKPPPKSSSNGKKNMGLDAGSKPTVASTEPPFIASLRGDQNIHEDDAPVYSASNIDDALFLLDATSSTSSLNKVERHPERRVKPALAAYEARELPLLKAEFPQLRLSQLKQKLYENWQKSPENPFNQSHVSYNATKSQEILRTQGEIESRLRQMQLPPS